MARRIFPLLGALLLSGCAYRYLLVTSAAALKCPVEELKTRERQRDYRVEGCGRWVSCNRVWWSGPDEWSCEEGGPIEPPAPPKPAEPPLPPPPL